MDITQDSYIGGSFNASTELNTPIKRIQDLQIGSPDHSGLYPRIEDLGNQSISSKSRENILESMDDTTSDTSTGLLDSMLNKGYSQKLTLNVLSELNSRASEIDPEIAPTQPKQAPKARTVNRKRFSGIHRSKFNVMESISTHYSVKAKEPEPQSDTKRRRTLNGPDDVLTYQSNNENHKEEEPSRKVSPQRVVSMDTETLGSPSKVHPTLVPLKKDLAYKNTSPQLPRSPKFTSQHTASPESSKHTLSPVMSPKIPSLKASPTASLKTSPKMMNLKMGPVPPMSTSSPQSSSKSHIPRLSPSKKSMDLNALMKDDDVLHLNWDNTTRQGTRVRSHESALHREKMPPPSKPYIKPASKTRMSSLEMAGVVRSSSENHIPRTSPHIPHSLSDRQIRDSDHNYTLSKKSSIPQLKKSYGDCSKSISRKSSIPQLSRKSSIPQLSQSVSQSKIPSYAFPTSSSNNKLNRKSSQNFNDKRDRDPDRSMEIDTSFEKSFSLYARPTVSSSQKSIRNRM